MTLTVTTALLDHPGLVAISGELDLAAIEVVPGRFDEVLAAGVDFVVLDLTGITFMDAAGLSVLLRCRQRAMSVGVRCVLTGAGRAVTRVMDLTRTEPVKLGLPG